MFGKNDYNAVFFCCGKKAVAKPVQLLGPAMEIFEHSYSNV